jgi:hypothetical protein
MACMLLVMISVATLKKNIAIKKFITVIKTISFADLRRLFLAISASWLYLAFVLDYL